jgi:hypothetical protein
MRSDKDATIILEIEGGGSTAAFIQFLIRRGVEFFSMGRVEDHPIRFSTSSQCNALHRTRFRDTRAMMGTVHMMSEISSREELE